MSIAYLDWAAAAPMLPEAAEAMLPFLTERFANPSGAHGPARAARRALDDARDRVAALLGVEPGEVVFTSGGTEADNLAVLGAGGDGVVVASEVEHPAVLEAAAARGCRLAPVDRTGAVDLDALADALGPDVAVVSLMLVNNEVGTRNPLGDAVALVRERAPQAVVHTDAVQAACWLDLADAAAGADLISISAHKFGGPKGVGALGVRRGVRLAPRLVGGGQERERRSGTPNVAGAVAMGVAAELTAARRVEVAARVASLRDRLVDGLLAALAGLVEEAVETVPRPLKTPGNAHVCLGGLESEALLFLLDRHGVCASAASACASGALQRSGVLEAMGVPERLARGAVRFTLGWGSSDADVDRALEAAPAAVAQLTGARR
ncbi:MAG: cysteine desulfurase family protein [Acidimicrobiales bacterium]